MTPSTSTPSKSMNFPNAVGIWRPISSRSLPRSEVSCSIRVRVAIPTAPAKVAASWGCHQPATNPFRDPCIFDVGVVDTAAARSAAQVTNRDCGLFAPFRTEEDLCLLEKGAQQFAQWSATNARPSGNPDVSGSSTLRRIAVNSSVPLACDAGSEGATTVIP